MATRSRPGRRPAPGARRILGAARRLFAQRGYDGTSVADVAAAAGVSKATVFHHYGSKQHLYESLVEDAVRGFRVQLVPLLDSEDGLQASLESFVVAHAARLAGMRGTIQLMMRGVFDGSPGSTRVLATSGMAQNFALVVDALRRAQARGAMRADADPGLAAIVLLWTTWFVVQNAGSVARNPHLATAASTAAYASEFARLLCLGLAPRRAPGIEAEAAP